jgi:hypothetical protein
MFKMLKKPVAAGAPAVRCPPPPPPPRPTPPHPRPAGTQGPAAARSPGPDAAAAHANQRRFGRGVDCNRACASRAVR